MNNGGQLRVEKFIANNYDSDIIKAVPRDNITGSILIAIDRSTKKEGEALLRTLISCVILSSRYKSLFDS